MRERVKCRIVNNDGISYLRAVSAYPRFLPVCNPAVVKAPPKGDAWLHEPKLDGYRVEASKDGPSVRLWSRNGGDLTARLRPIAEAVSRLPVGSVILDGEVVAVTPDGRPDFRALHSGSKHLAYYVFDLLERDGSDMRELPLVERKAKLAKLLSRPPDRVLLVQSFKDGEALLESCSQMGLEGIVSKLKESPYRSGRSNTWRKCKCVQWIEANRSRWEMFKG